MIQPLHLTSNLDLSPLQQYVREKIIPTSKKADQDSIFPIEIYQDLHRMGWLTSFVPQEFGGMGLPSTEMIHISKELAYGSCGVFTSTLINLLALSPIILYARPSLKSTLCREFIEDFCLWSYCMTEPDVGSDIANLKTTAVRVPGGYLLNGKKCFITNATVSKHLVVFANLGRKRGERSNLCAFYLPAHSPGISRHGPLEKMGQRDSDTGELFFENVFVPEHHLIGKEGEGLRIAFHCLQRSKTMIAAAAVGASYRALELITEYLQDRVLYGKPLLAQPTIYSQLADLHTKVEASWLLTCKAAATWDTNLSFAVKEASMAKSFSTDAAVHLMNEVLELFGGYGFCKEFEIERLYRDVKVFEIYEGPTLVQHALIARELFPHIFKVQPTRLKRVS